ncbi:MAG: menaquinone biosynthesis decarboxylase [Armatimonadetes bacterium]|nr:menaquinone biosynthesis decarboxylase [Armatimonadota bacterium]
MAYRDFQHFLDELQAKGELRRIGQAVSPYLEITEIADRVMKSGGPALLFENVRGRPMRLGSPDPTSAVMGRPSIHLPAFGGASPGETVYDVPVAINTMGSRRRMSLALGCADFEEHAERLRSLVKLPSDPPKSLQDALKAAPMLLQTLQSTKPKTVSSALCQEHVVTGADIDLTSLPVLTCWPEDAGPYVTLPMVFTHDPRTGKRNVGMYRVQVQGKDECGMHWQMHKTGMRHMEDAGAEGRRIQVAVCLGGDPAYMFSAISPLPPGIDEMVWAGFLRREPVKLVRCKTIDVHVPADCEMVLEGFVDPSERRLEGPFGDHTGYYSLAEDFPVFHVTCMTSRERPVWPATIVGRPPMEDGWMGKAVERIFLPLIQMTVPEIVDMNLPVEACFHNVAFVSIRKKYPGHAYKVMNALWGLGGLAFTKFVYVFDEDCDVQDRDEVLFRLGANCDPGRDVLHSKGPVDQLDHASQQEGFGGKLGFDCTHKWPGENGFSRPYPKLIAMSDDVKRKVDAMWPGLGLDR